MNDTILLNEPIEPFEEHVTAALKSLREGDLLALAASTLAHSSLVEPCFLSGEPITADGRGRILRSVLRWAVAHLRPEGEATWVRPLWRSFNILHYFYLEGMRASELAEKMAIAEQTLYQVRPQAISLLASVLRNELAQASDLAGRRNAVFADRYARHSSSEQRLLRVAAVFPSAVPVRVLAQAADELKLTDAAQATQSLILSHLVIGDELGNELVVHPQLRPYLLTLLMPEERRIIHSMAAEHYVQQQNFLEAAQQWRAVGQSERAALLLIEHQRDIIDNLQLEELVELLARFRAGEVSANLWPRLKILAGEIAEFTQNFAAAIAEYQLALGASDLYTKALAYYRRAKAFEHTNIDESLAHYARCVQLLEESLDSSNKTEQTASGEPGLERWITLVCNVYIDRAWLQMQVRPDLVRAEVDLARAQALLDQHPTLRSRPVWCDLYNALGGFYHRNGQAELAVQHTWQAWLAANESQDRERMSRTAHNLGSVYMGDLRQYDRALEYLRKSQELAQQMGNQQMAGLSTMSIGACYYWQGELRAAITQYQVAAEIFGESGNRTLLTRTYYGLAEAQIELGEGEVARQHYSEGVRIASELNDRGALRDFEELAKSHPQLIEPASALSTRQQAALIYLRQHGQLTNREYQEVTGVSQKQAVRDLNELVERAIVRREGKGRAIRYVISK